MKPDRIESLVSWLFTGAILIGIGLFFLIRGWFLPQLGLEPVHHRGGVLDSHLAMGGALLFLLIGVVIVVSSLIGKLRTRR